ncbi:coiled-coil domain-containing protein [Aliarcobacter cryaerophilus]|uniref:coiled-coil domain-containing protein n=1 Tax=Aliarcobacter cryaerophilus TaxID=28198 RepID=UPI0021B49538|nr:hypothetical protein [Aliarcobacter cryaerophilus]MCT7483922.1 hypothetical protein [Aliarcobacter cryaerophilus]
MRNYISVNAKHYKKKEIQRISEHNFRLQKIGYLLPKEHIKYENVNIIYANNITNKYENNLTKLGEYSQNLNELYNKKQLDNILKTQYQLLLKTKEDIQYKNKSYAKTNESTLVEMVVALSEEQAKFYLESGQDLGKGFDNFTKNLCEKYGFTPLQVSLHLDEGYVENGVTKLNVHAHLTFFNFDFYKERSVLRTLKKQDYKDLQDLAANSFQEVGFDFKRGESKELSGKEHLERNDFILAKQKEEIIKLDFEYKNLVAIVNSTKKKEQELLKSHEKLSSDYKEIYKSVGELKELEKTLRKIDFKNFNNETKLELNNIFKNNISGNKISNIEIFVKQITSFVKNIHKVEFTNINESEVKLKEKDEQIKKLEEQNSTLLNKLNEERNKNKALEQDKGQIAAQNQKLIQTMDKQQKALIRQTRRNTRLRNQRNRLLQKVMRDNNLTKAMQTRKFLKDNKTKSLNKSKIEKKQESYDFDR